MTATDQLAAIQARADAATEGPWHVDGEPDEAKYVVQFTSGRGVHVGTYITDLVEADEDAEFIAHARTDVPALLTLVREQQAALDELMYVANHKAADTKVGRWWAEVIRGPIINHLGAEAASQLGAVREQAYIVECEDLVPGDQVWFPSLFEAEQTCGPFPSCCVPKPVGADYDGPKWVPEDDDAALTATEGAE